MSAGAVKTPAKPDAHPKPGRRPAGGHARRQPAAGVVALQQAYGNVFVSRLLGGAPIQRACGCGGSCCSSPAEKLSGVVQRKPLGGAPLPPSTRSAMESSFGHDFGGVRVHSGPEAGSLASSLGARAFTSGGDVYFGRGEYQPGSPAGQGLIAHELAHVVQQRSARAPAAAIDTPGDPWEREADAAAAAVAAGRKPQLRISGGSPTIQRTNGAGPTQPTTLSHLAGTGAQSTRRLEIPGEKAISGADQAELQTRYETYAQSGALRTRVHAGRGSTNTLWNAWRQSRPFKTTDAEITEKRELCQPDHIIELQLGGPDHPDNLRLLSSSRNQAAGSKLAGNIREFLAVNNQPEDAVVTLLPNQVRIGQHAGGDPDCLGWERAKAGGRGTETAAAATVLRAKVGGLEVGIGWNPESGNIQAHSRYVVPLLRLNTVETATAGWVLEGVWSDRIETVPTSWRKPPNRKFRLVLPSAGADLVFEDKNDKLALQFPFLSEVQLDMHLENGDFKASGTFRPTLPILRNVDITVAIERQRLTAGVSVPPDKIKQALPIPGLDITEATLQLGIAQGRLTVTGGFAFAYTTIASGRVNATAGPGGFVATGVLDFHVPGLDTARGEVWVREGELGGRVTIGADKIRIPGVRSASLVVTIARGALAGEGTLELAIPGIKRARLGFGVDAQGNYGITGTAELQIPGTRDASLELAYRDGQLTGTGRASFAIPGLESAALELRYANANITGTASISYRRGRLSGTITVNLDEHHHLSGGGELAYEIAPGLVGFVGMRINPDGSMRIQGGLRVPETIDIFGRKQVEKELFRLPTIEIPIIAIPVGPRSVGLVATIEARLVARAGVGPGQLRKVRLLVDLDPAAIESSFNFEAAAELYVPADAELALAVSGGLGLSLAIARAIGGIEAEGAAGLRAEFVAGADLKFQQGQLAVSGRAELSAAPRLAFRVRAFVRVEVDLWITTIEVYSKEWQLASFEAGSSLRVGVRIPFEYVFGRPFELSLDQIEFIVPQIDPMQFVRELLPT